MYDNKRRQHSSYPLLEYLARVDSERLFGGDIQGEMGRMTAVPVV